MNPKLSAGVYISKEPLNLFNEPEMILSPYQDLVFGLGNFSSPEKLIPLSDNFVAG